MCLCSAAGRDCRALTRRLLGVWLSIYISFNIDLMLPYVRPYVRPYTLRKGLRPYTLQPYGTSRSGKPFTWTRRLQLMPIRCMNIKHAQIMYTLIRTALPNGVEHLSETLNIPPTDTWDTQVHDVHILPIQHLTMPLHDHHLEDEFHGQAVNAHGVLLHGYNLNK